MVFECFSDCLLVFRDAWKVVWWCLNESLIVVRRFGGI